MAQPYHKFSWKSRASKVWVKLIEVKSQNESVKMEMAVEDGQVLEEMDMAIEDRQVLKGIRCRRWAGVEGW